MTVLPRRATTLAILGVSFGSSLPAQNPVVPLPVAYSTAAIPFPVVGVAQVNRFVVGDFLNQRRRHVVALDGNRAYTLFSPATMSSIFALPASWVINDLAVLESGIANVGSFLVGVGVTGLTIARVTTDWGLDVVAGPAGTWATATRIKASGSLQAGMIVGLANNNYTLLVAMCSGGNVATTASLTLGRPIVDFDLVDWDGNQTDEVAVICFGGLRIYDALLQQQGGVFPGTVTGAGIATLRGGTAESIAWVRPTGTNFEISVIGAAAVEPAVTITGVTSFGGVTAADATGDRRPELLIAMPNSGEAMLFANLARQNPLLPSYSDLPEDKEVIDLSPVGSQPITCVPGFFDVDFDRHADVVAATAGPGAQVTVAVGVGHTVRTLPILGSTVIGAQPIRSSAATATNGNDYLWLQVNLPVGYSDFDMVDLQLWRELEVSPLATYQSHGLGLETVSIGHWHFDITAQNQGTPWIRVPVAPGNSSALTSTSNLWGELRFFDSNGGSDATTPSTVFGCQLRVTPSELEILWPTEFSYFSNPGIFSVQEQRWFTPGPIGNPGRTVLGGLILPTKLPKARYPHLPPTPAPPAPGTTHWQ